MLDSTFAFGNGTSLAAAHVSGMLAVLTGVMKDPKLARAELFKAAHSQQPESAGFLRAPEVCSVFSRMGFDCEQPALGLSEPASAP